jgi:hypothetical protein
MIKNAVKAGSNILATSLSVLRNYFDKLNQIIFRSNFFKYCNSIKARFFPGKDKFVYSIAYYFIFADSIERRYGDNVYKTCGLLIKDFCDSRILS